MCSSHIYYIASDGEFKYNNHTNLFHHRHQKQDTEFPKHIWKLQDKGINFNVKWSIAVNASTYKCGSRSCDLWLTGKYVIARTRHKNLLNERTELVSKCHHRNNYILKQSNRLKNYAVKSSVCSNGILSEICV